MNKNVKSVNNKATTALEASKGLPRLENGWNVGANGKSKLSRKEVEDYFDVKTTTDDALWKENVLTPFVGRSLRIVSFDIIEGNSVNAKIKKICDTTSVVWTFAEDSMSESIAWVPLSGHSVTAGWINATANVEHDDKTVFGVVHTLDDWGVFSVEDVALDNFTVSYWSMEKGRFRMQMKEV